MKTKICMKGMACKTSPGKPIPYSKFGTHRSGVTKGMCNRCHNGTASPLDSFSDLQLFMARTLWGKSEQVAINDYASQIRMVL